ncbi:acidic repeat protein [Treponema pallidum subsp. pertenue]|uniref:Acidic repeat protein n=3 Tax=Treponema pallidum subsp. pertenue TaxID=168 RepID=E5FNP1_TREPE|nr:SPOR domain-containing protein [Treponema pallidum]ADR64292.1 acidic repeat protein [Treponema pallidum subsp. pertenue]AEZ58625.1 acidic repeat protein [Treponema pallidum subsp. pertenue str. CDC2]AYE89717.1 acidic repeat protein [Treponema pallidum subsp. pertenue]
MIKRHMFAKRGVKGRSYLVRVNTAFLVLCVASVTPLWAVWEGNAEIGPQGSFLQDGMFVRSDMFPKNTAVEISNLEKNAKAQAVVIGHAGIPGLLVSLAPAAAAQLGIGVYQAVRVRVRTLGTVRGGSQTSQDGLSLASLPSRVPARPAQRDPLSSPPAGHTVPEYRDTVIFDDPRLVSPLSREVEDVPKVVEPASEREGGEREVEDVPKVVEPASEREGGEREVEDVPKVVEPASEREGGEREVEDVPKVVEPASEREGGEREVASQHTKQPSHSVSNSAPNQFRNPEGELPFTLPDLSESEIVVPEEQKGRAHPQVIPEGAPRGLQPGEYYVQIAVFHDAIQVQSIVHRYGVEYPIAVEQDIHEGKVRFTVCVGPVQKDERGAVLENFQRFGFKDAFLKKAR